MQRYNGRSIEFEADGSPQDLKLPAELFDSVADNLIENALGKAAAGRRVRVTVTFSPARGGTLTVCDTGPAVPKTIAEQLFNSPVSSQTGLGVALYQSGRQATQLGYRLALAANEPGTVCFVLTRAEAGGSERP